MPLRPCSASYVPMRAHIPRGRICQQVLKMTAPPGRIIAVTVFADGGPIEDAFDPAAQPDGRLGLDVPDRPQDPDDQVSIDVGHGERPEHRRRIARQRRFPLRSMLDALLATAVRVDVRRRALVERLEARRAQRAGGRAPSRLTIGSCLRSATTGTAALFPR
jgi:hypothetical protein